VTADGDHRVVDRRRIELIEPGVPSAPIHHDGKRLDLEQATALVERVRASVVRAAAHALDDLAASLPEPIESFSLRALPASFPQDIATQRRSPYEARADAVMYRTVLVELAEQRGWIVHYYLAKDVEQRAAELLGDRATGVLYGPREVLGPPWTKDHRMALAATVLTVHKVSDTL
jgi:hypothetical protein